MKKSKIVSINFKKGADEELLEWVKAFCLANDNSVSRLIRSLLRQFREGWEAKNNG